MTKDEFYAMFNSELEKLELQIYEAGKKVNFYSLISNGSDQDDYNYNNAMYEKTVLMNRRELLTGFVGFIAYSRIQAMSDLEVEEYKKEKIKELDNEILRLKFNEEAEKINFELLKSRRDLLILKLGSLTEEERAAALDDIKKAQDLQARVFEYETKSDENIFTKNQKAIQAIKNLQESIMGKTSQEIKDYVCSEIKEKKSYEETVKRYKEEEINPLTRLLASVYGDYDKLMKITELFIKKHELGNKLDGITGSVSGFSWEKLPKEFKNGLEKIGVHSTLPDEHGSNYSFNVIMLDELSEYINKYKAKFEEQKKRILEENTNEKLCKIYPGNKSVIDYDFLLLHEEKIPDYILQNIKHVDSERSVLKSRFFKRAQLREAEEDIILYQDQAYSAIRDWYSKQDFSIVDLSVCNNAQIYHPSSLSTVVKMLEVRILSAETALMSFVNNFEITKAKVEDEKSQVLSEIDSCSNEIRNISGPGFEKAVIPGFSWGLKSDIPKKVSDLVKQAATVVQTKELTTKAQVEANNQADVREAELRGITLEELKQLRVLAGEKNQEQTIISTSEQPSNQAGFDYVNNILRISQFIEEPEQRAAIERLEDDIEDHNKER